MENVILFQIMHANREWILLAIDISVICYCDNGEDHLTHKWFLVYIDMQYDVSEFLTLLQTIKIQNSH